MARPALERSTHQRLLGDTTTMKVHDLRNEKSSCEIDQIIRAGHAVTFSPDTLTQARSEGYDNGYWCLGNAHR